MTSQWQENIMLSDALTIQPESDPLGLCFRGWSLYVFCALSSWLGCEPFISFWPGNLAHTKGKGTGSGRYGSRPRSPQRSVNLVKVRISPLQDVCPSPSARHFRRFIFTPFMPTFLFLKMEVLMLYKLLSLSEVITQISVSAYRQSM